MFVRQARSVAREIFHRRRGALRISNIQFATDRQEVKQVKVCNIVTCPVAGGEIAIRQPQAENALLAAGFPHIYLFRPAYIYPVEPRKEPNCSYLLLRTIYPAFGALFPNQVIRADDLARAIAIVDAVVRGTGQRGGQIFENRDIRAMVESLHTHE